MKTRSGIGAEKKVGLARALSKMGICSRSDAAEKIRTGRVKVNGAVRRDIETPVRVGRDKIEVDGHGVAAKEFVYWVVNKPRGIVTTAEEKNSWIEVVLEEGKSRQIRRMLEGCGVEVLRLIRVGIGGVELGRLAKGAAREMTRAEIQMLDRSKHGRR